MVIDLIVFAQNVYYYTLFKIFVILPLIFLNCFSKTSKMMKNKKIKIAKIYIDILTINDDDYPEASISEEIC